jgi:uncharacterized oligopeptide transporter (OPT) family protein
MQLNIQTWIIFFLLALLMGLNNIYSTLLTGWGDGGSIVAVILCLIFLPKKQRNILTYNLGQTIASAGGAVGFSVAIIASIYYIYQKDGLIWKPHLFDLSLLVMALSVMGVALAAPLRRYIVYWFFPSAVACATILRTVTSEDLLVRKRARQIMGISGFISAIFTIPAKVALKPGGKAIFSKIKLFENLSLSVDPILYGIGIVVGPRIGFSMILGGLINVIILTPAFKNYGIPPEEHTRWTAVGLMTLPAFTSMIFAYFLKCKKKLPPGFSPKESIEDQFLPREIAALIITFLFGMGIAVVEMQKLFEVTWEHVVLGAMISGPMCFALGKVASETDINPVRLLAIALLFVFSILNSYSPVALLALGITGATFAAVAVDLFYDLRTGYLIRANPKQQILLQFLGVIPVSFAAVYFLNLLTTNFGLGEGEYFPAPGAIIWATMAEAFSQGGENIPSGVWVSAGIASLVGIVLTFFENWGWTQRYSISSFALGISLLLPFEMGAAIFLGSLLRYIAFFLARNQGEETLRKVEEGAFKSGSAIFAASSIAGIVAVLLITLGILYLPAK